MTLDFFLQRKNGPWDGSVDGKVWFGKDRTVFFLSRAMHSPITMFDSMLFFHFLSR